MNENLYAFSGGSASQRISLMQDIMIESYQASYDWFESVMFGVFALLLLVGLIRFFIWGR